MELEEIDESEAVYSENDRVKVKPRIDFEEFYGEIEGFIAEYPVGWNKIMDILFEKEGIVQKISSVETYGTVLLLKFSDFPEYNFWYVASDVEKMN